MPASLTIVTYHYVRDLPRTRYPAIKGLLTARFREQVETLRRQYHLIGGRELLEAAAEGAPLPPRALLLTFDDGYADHFTQVFPILDELGLTGCFFPPAQAILEDRVLAVNKLHLVLAAAAAPALVARVFDLLDAHQPAYGLPAKEVYWQRLAAPGRYDGPDVMFLKRLLQRELPAPLRETILQALFEQYVSRDEAAIARELYMTADQLRCLLRQGMTLGCHGYSHAWLNSLAPSEQASEIERALAWLGTLGVDTRRWLMCYPYGAHDASLRALLAARGCVAGLTTAPGVADLTQHDPLALPRMDTNDIAREAAAAPALAQAVAA